ncbi:lyase family protein [Roseibium aggregatum]|uniref:3-carboxy-cis,cis-muconate cycloisomerase n=1 Tax=Roseibium aggregatum TaxID=187304 RepID=A0A939ELJ4_9HYPH|nr:lyase family protein [Roseibium aggregatum]MBN9673780.1 3-carboxy-cis,cis-muconate cycloisomerase [Roseibium aggregatum]
MPVSLFSSPIYSGLFSDEELSELFGDASDIAHMIAFERALARVQGRLGVIPHAAAEEIDSKLETAAPDPAGLTAGTLSAGVPVPALVAQLRKLVGGEAGQWLHWGATTQDVMDTALVLQLRACFGLYEARLARLIDTLETASNRFSDQLLAGRTRSQIATPITLGYRIAQWAHPLIDAEQALAGLRETVLKVQFGGASGVNGAIAPDGMLVSDKLALELGLQPSPSWHLNRSPLLALACWLQQVSSGLAKMAGDLVLLGRSDIAEVSSGTGGGSSTMPQKANPIQAETILGLNQIAIAAHAGLTATANPNEERDGAKWPLEWHFLPQMLLATGTALRHAQSLAETLSPKPDAIAATFAANPEIMAETASFVLAKAGVPRAQAKDLVAAASSDPLPFVEALTKHCPVRIDWQVALDPSEVITPAKEMSARIFSKRVKDQALSTVRP